MYFTDRTAAFAVVGGTAYIGLGTRQPLTPAHRGPQYGELLSYCLQGRSRAELSRRVGIGNVMLDRFSIDIVPNEACVACRG